MFNLKLALQYMLEDQALGRNSVDFDIEVIPWLRDKFTVGQVLAIDQMLNLCSLEELCTICVRDRDLWPTVYDKLDQGRREDIHRALDCINEFILQGGSHERC